MILIFGGTTEGRLAVETLDEAGAPYFYSTRGEAQAITCRHGQRITGALDGEAMAAFCREKEIRLLVDAGHPFAERLRQTIAGVARQLGIPVIRLERQYPERAADIHWCDSFDEAIRRLEADGVDRLLALTGVQTIGKLASYWSRHETYFRVLDRPESVELALRQGFPRERLCFYHDDAADEALFEALRPEAILTKESGESGGFPQKVAAARRLGIAVYAVCRPALPEGFVVVTGRHGLRREVERLLPGFYPLRTGLTTGTCATVAAVAALARLLSASADVEEAAVTLPDGERLLVPIASLENNGEEAIATVRKDAGDDPDVTDGAAIVATVSWLPAGATDRIEIAGGVGVGRVTLPGLGIAVGEAAINATPRRMILENLERALRKAYGDRWPGVRVVISVPEGAELAKRTFNPRLGIVGGISILGTSGIVKPFSSEAFVNSIRKEMGVAIASGTSAVVINSGAKSERFLRAYFLGLPAQAFVQYGNFIGETIQVAAEAGATDLRLGIMLGKAVKLAEGHLDTHSHKVVFNRDYLTRLATEAGCSPAAIDLIGRMTLARELWEGLSTDDSDRFFPRLLDDCLAVCAPLFPGRLTILLIDDAGSVRYQVDHQR